jgi:hypothetical protein
MCNEGKKVKEWEKKSTRINLNTSTMLNHTNANYFKPRQTFSAAFSRPQLSVGVGNH